MTEFWQTFFMLATQLFSISSLYSMLSSKFYSEMLDKWKKDNKKYGPSNLKLTWSSIKYPFKIC